MNGGRKKQARKKKTAERKNPPRPRRAKIRPADYANHPKKSPRIARRAIFLHWVRETHAEKKKTRWRALKRDFQRFLLFCR